MLWSLVKATNDQVKMEKLLESRSIYKQPGTLWGYGMWQRSEEKVFNPTEFYIIKYLI